MTVTTNSPPELTCLVTKRPDLIEVRSGGVVLGYVEIVGAVFVVLVGSRYDLAIEVLQTTIFERALGALSVA